MPHKEIGWTEHGEVFFRYTILKTRWFNVYLHELTAPNWPPHCHDHPWTFVTLILKNGYWEMLPNGKVTFYGPGNVLYRHATYSHNVKTKGTAWSLVLTSSKIRDWRFGKCNTFT